MTEKIFGLDWMHIVAMQNKQSARKTIDTTTPGDYGSDPMVDGMFRMIPSGDIVDLQERNARLEKRKG